MFEIRIHGRAGQGAKMAAQLLAEAALKENKYIQAWPEYGPERSGAPVVAFVRIDKEKILTHEPVVIPEAVLVLDYRLLENKEILKGLTKKGILLINSSKKLSNIYHLITSNIYSIDASGIALKYLGSDKPNVPLLGALIKISKIVKLESFLEVIKERFGAKLGAEGAEANIKAAKEGHDKINF